MVVDKTAAWLDAALMRRRMARMPPACRPDADRLADLDAHAARFGDERLLAWPGGLLVRGGPIDPIVAPRTPTITDLGWPSPAGDGPNATAWARLHAAGPAPGPVVVAIHGYGGGRRSAQRFMWPVRAWNQLGLHVVLPALPHHGPRASAAGLPPLPADDPPAAHAAFGQVVHDVTALLGWLRAQGYGPIGVVGRSLGGYIAALLATLDDDLACLALVIPLGSIADFARAHGRLGDGPAADALHERLVAALRPICPLARPPRVPADRVRIVAVRGDQVTGVAHAERLGRHFGVAPTVGPGGHVLQLGVDWPGTVAFTSRFLTR